MRMLILLLCLLSAQAWADRQTLYVRTVADCAANGCGSTNGSSFANAYNGMADVSFSATDGTALSLDPEDTLIICAQDGASFADADKDVSTSMIQPSADISGTSRQAMTTFDGDCSAQPGYSAMAKWDGGGALDRGFDSGSTNKAYIKVKNLEITGFDSRGVYAQGAYTDTKNWEFDNVWIHDNRGASTKGLDFRGIGLTLRNSTIENSGDDNVYIEGANALIVDNTLDHPSLDGLTGDNIQLDKSAANTRVLRNYMRNGVDIKQCFFASTTITGDGYGWVDDNLCYGPSSDPTAHTAFFVENANGGRWVFRRNYAEKSRYLIYCGGDGSDVKCTAIGNVGRDLNTGIQGGTGTSDHVFQNNSIFDATVCISTEAATGTSTIQNNALRHCTTAGIRKNSGDTESYNAVYDSGDFVQNETVATSAGTGAVTADPGWASASPTTIAGFCLTPDSPLLAAGTYIGAYATGYGGEDLGKPPAIGARGLCRSRQSTASRPVAATRVTAPMRPVSAFRPWAH